MFQFLELVDPAFVQTYVPVSDIAEMTLVISMEWAEERKDPRYPRGRHQMNVTLRDGRVFLQAWVRATDLELLSRPGA